MNSCIAADKPRATPKKVQSPPNSSGNKVGWSKRLLTISQSIGRDRHYGAAKLMASDHDTAVAAQSAMEVGWERRYAISSRLWPSYLTFMTRVEWSSRDGVPSVGESRTWMPFVALILTMSP